MTTFALGAAVFGAAGYGIYRLVAGARAKGPAGGKPLLERYRPGTEEPGPLSGDWPTYAGAREELRGAPANTILLVRGLDRHPPEFRARLLDVAELVKIPVDSLAVVMSSESNGMDPTALNPLPAAGLIQLTVGANLPGFRVAPGELTKEQARAKIREIVTWSAEEQLERVVKPYMARMKLREPPTPGRLYMLNFLPAEASKPDDTVIGIEGDEKRGPDGAPVMGKDGKPELSWAGQVFKLNAGFWQGKRDGQGRRVITVGDVKDKARQVARGAKGRRITVDGKVLEPRAAKGIAAAVPARAAEPKSVPPVAKAAPAPATSPVQALVLAASDEVHDLNEPAGGLLLLAQRSGKLIMPEWRTVRVGDLELEVMADALQAAVRLVDTGPRVVKDSTRGVLPAKDLGRVRLRLPVSWLETLELARALGAVPFTREWWDAAWKAADKKITPAPLPATDEMGSLRWTLRHTQNVDAQAAGPGVLLRDVGKGWIIPSPADAAANERIRTARAVNYGWLQPGAGRPIQTPGTRHDEHHYDYSQTCVLVRRQVRKGGATFDALQVLASLGYEGRWLHALAA